MFIFLSLLAGFVYILVNFCDRAIVSKYVTDWRVAVLFGSIAGGVLALLILPFRESRLSFFDSSLIVLSGIILWIGYVLYWKVISESNAISITMLLQLSPVVTLTLSYLILGEELTLRALAGFFLILLSIIGFSVKKDITKKEVFQPKPFILISIASVLFGFAAIIAKHAISETDFITATSWEGLGVFLAGFSAFALSKSMRQSFISTFKTNFGLPLVFIFSVEAIYLGSRFTSYAATGLGPVAIERVLEGARIFFAFAIGLLLSKILPSVFAREKEDITLRKIILAVVLFLGIYLVS